MFVSYATLLTATVSRLLLRLGVLLGLGLLVVLLGGRCGLVGLLGLLLLGLRGLLLLGAGGSTTKLHLQQILTDGDGVFLIDQELLNGTSLGSVNSNVDLKVGRG
jgi:hypothetical protein